MCCSADNIVTQNTRAARARNVSYVVQGGKGRTLGNDRKDGKETTHYSFDSFLKCDLISFSVTPYTDVTNLSSVFIL
jgi:hypothetical protein